MYLHFQKFRSCAALFALLTLTGCARTINRAAERRIREALPNVLGPAKNYQVHVDNAPDRTLRGRLANVAIDGDEVSLGNGLVLDHLRLDLKGVEVDTDRGAVTQVKEARFAATLGKANLDEYLAGETAHDKTIRKPRIQLESDRVTLSAERVTVLNLSIPFSLAGPLKLVPPRRIELDSDRLTVVGIPLWGAPLRYLKQRFDSAVDLSSLSFPVTLSNVRVEPGRLLLTGTADVMTLLQNERRAAFLRTSSPPVSEVRRGPAVPEASR